MSRPTLLTEELQREICGYIENGNSYTTAYRLAGIGETTFHEWKSKGEKDIEAGKESVYAEFAVAIKRANEKCKAWNVQQIMNAAGDKKHWTAAAWLLERKWPEEFAKTDKIDHTGRVKIIFDKDDEGL